MRGLKRAAIAGVLIGLCAVTAYAVAQGPPPTVAVTVSQTAVTAPPGPVPAGPTRMQVTRQGSGDVSVYFALLNAGVSREEFEAALRRDDRNRSFTAAGMVWIQGSVSLGENSSQAVTFTLRPGLTYIVLAEFQQDDRPPRRLITTLTTTGASNGATAPAPDATVRMAGLRFRGGARLPRQGRVRVVNNDAVPHFALAFPLRRQATSRRLGRALRTSGPRGEAALNRLLAGPPTMVQDIISGGGITNDNEVQFSRRGRYALVCFFDRHHELGMYRIVSVR